MTRVLNSPSYRCDFISISEFCFQSTEKNPNPTKGLLGVFTENIIYSTNPWNRLSEIIIIALGRISFHLLTKSDSSDLKRIKM